MASKVEMATARKSDLNGIYLAAIENDNPREVDIDVFIVNLSGKRRVLQLLTGAFEGDSDVLLDLGHTRYRTIVVPAEGFVKIDHFSDSGELDFMTYYNVKAEDLEFLAHINGWALQPPLIDIPILNQKGYLAGFGKVGT